MITGKDIRHELQGNYASYIVIVLVFAAIAAFCTIFCGTQLGWSHIFTIIGFIMCGISIIAFIWVMIKLIKVRNHRLFKKYGPAEIIAEYINQGMRSPRYHANSLLITERFIVNEGRYSDYLEIKDIKSIRPEYSRDNNVILLSGNVATTVAGTVATNYANKMYRDAKGITANNRFDNLHIIDIDGIHHYYSVHHSDVGYVIQLLNQLVPYAEITS